MTDFESNLDKFLRARFTLLVLASHEEERLLTMVSRLCERTRRLAFVWDLADGLRALCGEASLPATRDPMEALAVADAFEDEAVFVLKDFHACWDDPLVKRALRNVAQRMRRRRKNLIVTTPQREVPEELKDEAVVLAFPAPGIAELSAVLDDLAQAPGVAINLSPRGREQILEAALGLTVLQTQRVFTRSLVDEGNLGDAAIAAVLEEKRQIIRQSEALEFYAPSENMADVGGLRVLKQWLEIRARAFSREARAYGISAPKGIALVGIPGTGKSLAAKMIGSFWKLPLLRLDVGALFGSYVGESEERARRALSVAETIAPCMLWIDELEKALAQGSGDSGAGTRVFGTILTWMQEKTSPCFVIATANDISKLPPELLRRGRFDEIFFLDLPNREERREIFTVHLRKRARAPEAFDLNALAENSAGYVGAEIEQAIIDAMFVGFNEGREFNTRDVVCAVKRQVPMSKSAQETVSALRRLLVEGRAQSASAPSEGPVGQESGD